MPPSPSLVLASSSPYKRRLLTRLGVEFDVQSPEISESRLRAESPTSMARRLARKKARTVAETHPESHVLGTDQVIALDDKIFQKPGTKQRAIEHLRTLQGKTHRLLNAICLKYPDGSCVCSTQVYEMVMRPLDTAQVTSYVDADSPLDCAGAYRIESAGIRLFEATRGDDPTGIEGLPLLRVWTLLLEAGWSHD